MAIDLTAHIHQYLTTAPGSLFAQQEVAIVDHWQGDANLLWRVRLANQDAADQDAVVKLFLDAGQARSRRQFDGHQHFAPLGIAPEGLWADRYPHGLPRQLMVYRWIEGESVNPDDPGELLAWAEAIATLHTAPVDEVTRFSPHPINLDYYWRIEQASVSQIERWLAPSALALSGFFGEIADATRQLVETYLPLWAVARPTAIHGDLSLAHSLLARGRVLLLDWEMFGLGDPALDVARLLQREAQNLDEDQIELWLDRYLQSTDQPAMAERIELFRRLLEVHNVIYLLVGLQQHTMRGIDGELQDALPFLENTLGAALDHAAAALSLTVHHDPNQLAADFFVWLHEKPSVSR